MASKTSSEEPSSTLTQRTTAPSTQLQNSTTTSQTQSNAATPSPSVRMFDQSTGILMGMNISMLECLFILMEFIFGTVIFPAVWRLGLQYPCSMLYPQYVCDEIYRILGYFTVAYWLLHRCSWTTLQSFQAIWLHVQYSLNPDLLTTPYPHTEKKPNRNVLYYFVGTHVFSIMIFLILQFITGESIYSLENFFVETTTSTGLIKGLSTTLASNSTAIVDEIATAAMDTAVESSTTSIFSLPRAAFLMFFAPLFEECIFRVVMLTFVHLRMAKYFPGRIQLTETLESAREDFNKPKKNKKKIIIRRTAKDISAATPTAANTTEPRPETASNNNDDDNNNDTRELEPVQTQFQAKDSKYNVAPFNIAQYSTVLAAVAFGLIHMINLLNGYNVYYVVLQATIGVLSGIIFNAAAYQYGLLTTLCLHIGNNVVASFISHKTDIFSSPLLTFGFFETALCYGSLAYISLKNLSNRESESIPYVLKTAPIRPESLTPSTQQQQQQQEITTIQIPRHYQAFNNRFIHHACQQCDLPH